MSLAARSAFTSGEPIGLVAKNGDVYMLMCRRTRSAPRWPDLPGSAKAAADHLGHIMEVTGTCPSTAATKPSTCRVTSQSNSIMPAFRGVAVAAAPLIFIGSVVAGGVGCRSDGEGFQGSSRVAADSVAEGQSLLTARWELGRALYFDPGSRRMGQSLARRATIQARHSRIAKRSLQEFAGRRAAAVLTP